MLINGAGGIVNGKPTVSAAYMVNGRARLLEDPVLFSSLLSCYHLEEAGTADRVDAVNGGGFNLACTTTGRDTGKVGPYCTKFNNVTGGSMSVNKDDFNFQATPFSVCMWVKRDNGGAAPNVSIYYDGGGAVAWRLIMNATDITAELNDAGFSASDTVTIADATWAFLCLRFDGGTDVTVNVNNRPKVSAAASTCGDSSGGTLYVAGNAKTYVDEIVIAPYAFTDGQVEWEYNAGAGRLNQ